MSTPSLLRPVVLLCFVFSQACVDTVNDDPNDDMLGLNGNTMMLEPLNMIDDFQPVSTQAGTMQAGEGMMAGTEMEMGGIQTTQIDTAGTSMQEAGTSMQEAGTSMDPPPMDPPPMTGFPDFAVAMLEYVNEFRSTGGTCGSTSLGSAPPLALNALLNQAAQAHAEDMGALNYFDHNSLDGRSPWDRIGATGYQGSAFGENIAAGRRSAQEAFTQWKNSPGHCSNMLNPNFNELGVGYANAPSSQYRHYWVQNFARGR